MSNDTDPGQRPPRDVSALLAALNPHRAIHNPGHAASGKSEKEQAWAAYVARQDARLKKLADQRLAIIRAIDERRRTLFDADDSEDEA